MVSVGNKTGRIKRLSGAAVVLAVCLLVLGLPAAGAQPESEALPTAQDISVRDQLIADQENLLNTYRCLFDTDLDAVPGQCPNPDTVTPGAAPQTPTRQDLAARDQLIANQEALLNIYRCQFNIDTQLVPQSCTTQPDPQPTTQPEVQPTAISAGGGHSCAIRADNTIECWGHNFYGQADAPEGQFTAISAGLNHSCAIRADNTIACWGDNRYGQLDAPEGQFTAIAAGDDHSCAIRADNTIACWGINRGGEVDAPGGQFTAIAAGQGHSCAIRADNTIACWDWTTNLPAGVTLVPRSS
ncbi:MAG: hypothetical protein OXE45_13225 [bacterium]|nr:hypothetical protein [bacterium]